MCHVQVGMTHPSTRCGLNTWGEGAAYSIRALRLLRKQCTSGFASVVVSRGIFAEWAYTIQNALN
jgi:hypothetical protein